MNLAVPVAITPTPRQLDALECPAFELLFGGSKGGGKSAYLLMCWGYLLDAARKRWQATGIPQMQCRIVIFRKNLNDLKDLIIKSHRTVKAFDPRADFNKNEKTWYFECGATMEFAHLDGPDDHRGWNGNEIIGLGFDQVEELPEEAYSWLVGQVRTSDPYYKPLCRVRATANPGGIHGAWVKRYFIEPCPAGDDIVEVEHTLSDGRKVKVTRAFIRSALRDNPHLNGDGEYEARLRNLPEHLVKMWLDGDWDAVEGAFFASKIKPRVHGMTWAEFLQRSPDGIPTSWEIGAGLDWGASAPAAWEIAARDAEDRVWFFDELYGPGVNGRTFGERMRKVVATQQWNRRHRWSVDDFYTVVDSEAWARFGADGAAPADTIASMGFRLFPANKDRKAGVEQFLDRLQVRADGLPGIIVITDRCPHLWRTLQTVPVDKKNPEDYEMRSEAHAVDSARFKLMDWPVQLHAPLAPVDADMARWDRLIEDARKRQNGADSW